MASRLGVLKARFAVHVDGCPPRPSGALLLLRVDEVRALICIHDGTYGTS